MSRSSDAIDALSVEYHKALLEEERRHRATVKQIEDDMQKKLAVLKRELEESRE